MWVLQRLLAPVGFAVVAFCYGLPFAEYGILAGARKLMGLAVDGLVLSLRFSRSRDGSTAATRTA